MVSGPILKEIGSAKSSVGAPFLMSCMLTPQIGFGSKAMIYAIDTGSTIPRRNTTAYAWCAVDDAGVPDKPGHCPSELVSRIASDIHRGESVALGIEAPQFIPVPTDRARLSLARTAEGNRSWSAPTGGHVAALAEQTVSGTLCR
jgi:hypothetical protein